MFPGVSRGSVREGGGVLCFLCVLSYCLAHCVLARCVLAHF